MNKQAKNPRDRDVMYQVSLLQGLTNGDYQGSVPVGELKDHGDIGLGTFDGLNGELIMLDGTVYRAAGDGSVELVSDTETVPFCVVTYMDADASLAVENVPSYDAFHAMLDELVDQKGKNRFYMVRVDGSFRTVNVRSVNAQQGPYRRLSQVMEDDQTFYDYRDMEGTLVGLYCPPYMSYLNAVGWHLHFISKDRTRGGHVLGVDIDRATLTWDDTDGFQVRLPQSECFSAFDLTVDQTREIERIETNK